MIYLRDWVLPYFLVQPSGCSLDAVEHGYVDTLERVHIIMKTIALLVFLLLTVVSGCSTLSNSESFYRDHPPSTHIRWHEYTE